MRPLLFAANWKLNLGPDEARAFARRFRKLYALDEEREIWFFPSAVSVEAAARELRDVRPCSASERPWKSASGERLRTW